MTLVDITFKIFNLNQTKLLSCHPTSQKSDILFALPPNNQSTTDLYPNKHKRLLRVLILLLRKQVLRLFQENKRCVTVSQCQSHL